MRANLRKNKTVTLKDISRSVGVGISTVSQVLNHKPVRCAPQTRELIAKTAKELGYIPNIIGRSLRSKKTHSIGLIAPALALELDEIEFECWHKGYCLNISATHNSPDKQDEILMQFRQRHTDGVLIFQPVPGSELIKSLASENYPLVIVDVDILYPQADTFYVDLEGCVRYAVEYLLTLGHKRIAAIFSESNFPHTKLRRKGWISALTDAGIEPAGNWYIPLAVNEIYSSVYKSAYDTGKEFIKRFKKNDPNRPTAIYTAVDEVAVGVISAFRNTGWDIPRDISVIGMHALEIGKFTNPKITSVDVHHRQCRKDALKHLLSRVSGTCSESLPVYRKFPFEIVEGESTAPPSL